MSPITTNLTCICCPLGCNLSVRLEQTDPAGCVSVTGNRCPRGKQYAIEELTTPKRIITSTVKITGGRYPVLPVKTEHPVPKEKLFTIMKILASVTAKAPINIGEIIMSNVDNTGINIVATKTDLGRGVRAAEGA